MHVPTLHPRAWEALFAFRMADKYVLRRRSPQPRCLTCSPGSRLELLPSIALPPGRCWLRLLFSGFCPVCYRLGILLFMWSSAQTTPLPSRRPGRASRSPEACVSSSGSFACFRKPSASDALSRAVPPATLGFQPSEVLSVPWTSFPAVPHLTYFPLSSLMEGYVASSV